jgi:hypothetical protein
MMLALMANFEVLIQLLVVEHRGASRTLGPQAFGNIFLFRLRGPELGLFYESGV